MQSLTVLWSRLQSWLLLCLVALVPLQAQAQAQAEAPRDVVLILDNSGSMRKADPKFVLRDSAAGFIDSLKDADRIAVVMFDERVEVLSPLGPADAQGREAAKATLSKLDYRGRWTDSPRAVERAIYELKQAGRPLAQLQALLMSDGVVDTGDSARNVQLTDWLRKDLTNEAVKAKIRIFALAFTDKADTLLLQSLASRTEAEYARADTPEDLPTAFMRLAELMTQVAVATAPQEVTPTAPPAPTVGPLAAVLGRTDAEATALAEALGMSEETLLQDLRARGGNPALFQGLDADGLATTVGALVKPAPSVPPAPSPDTTQPPAPRPADPAALGALAKTLQVSEQEAQGLSDRFKRSPEVLQSALTSNGLEASHFEGLTLDDKTALLEELLKTLPAVPGVAELAAFLDIGEAEAEQLAADRRILPEEFLKQIQERGGRAEDFRGSGLDAVKAALVRLLSPEPDGASALGALNPMLLALGGGGAVLVLGALGWFLLRPKSPVLQAAEAGGGAVRPPSAGAGVIPEAFLTDTLRVTGKARHDLGRKPLVIGRVAGNDPSGNDYLVIEQATVGRRHALIEFRDIAYWVVDQGSVNGTFVNGEQLPSEGARRLKDGDRVKFHRYEFQFSMPQAAAEDMEKTRIAQAPGDATIIADRTVVAATATLIQEAAALKTSATELAKPPAPANAGFNAASTLVRQEPEDLGGGTSPTILRTPSAVAKEDSGAGDNALDMFMATNMFAASIQPSPQEPAPAPTDSGEGGRTVVLPAPVVTLDPSETSHAPDPAGHPTSIGVGQAPLPPPVLQDMADFQGFAEDLGAAPPPASQAGEIAAEGGGFFDEPLPTTPATSPVAGAEATEFDGFFGATHDTPRQDAPIAAAPPELPATEPAAPTSTDDLLMGRDPTVIMGMGDSGNGQPVHAPEPPRWAEPPPAPIAPPPSREPESDLLLGGDRTVILGGDEPPQPAAPVDNSGTDATVMPGFRPTPATPPPVRPDPGKPSASLDDFDFDAFFDDDQSGR